MKSLNSYFLTAQMADISEASSVYIPIPDGGRIIGITTVLQSAISVANAVVTAYKGATALTNGALTVAYTSSAAGDVDSCSPTAANQFSTGEVLKITSDGGSTTTAILMICVEVSRTAR